MALSQDEIDKLMSEGSEGDVRAAQARLAVLSRIAAGLVRSIENIVTVLVSAQKVTVRAENPSSNDLAAIGNLIRGQYSVCHFNINALCKEPWIIAISNNLALDISQKMMGQEGAEELSEALLSAMVEAMNNILGAFSTALSEEFRIDRVTYGDVKFIENASAENIAAETGLAPESIAWLTKLPVTIDDMKGEMALILSDSGLSALVDKHPEISAEVEVPNAPADAPMKRKLAEPDKQITRAKETAAQTAQVAVFENLEPRHAVGETKGIDLILDVPLNITVELGRKHLSVKDILALTPGSLVELDKLAGEAVDLLVNGKLFAKGEVVVIDENFGVRVSSIVTPKERLERLSGD